MVHFIGDMHQPLHCGDRGDKGGIGTLCWLLEPEGKASSLHTVWDTLILKRNKQGERVAPYADRLDNKITEEQIGKWTVGNLIAWANESHGLARDVAYNGVPISAEGVSPLVLDQAYFERATPVIEQQLQRGGIRLAAVLNRAFAK